MEVVYKINSMCMTYKVVINAGSIVGQLHSFERDWSSHTVRSKVPRVRVSERLQGTLPCSLANFCPPITLAIAIAILIYWKYTQGD